MSDEAMRTWATSPAGLARYTDPGIVLGWLSRALDDASVLGLWVDQHEDANGNTTYRLLGVGDAEPRSYGEVRWDDEKKRWRVVL